jgi:hypothetical protein
LPFCSALSHRYFQRLDKLPSQAVRDYKIVRDGLPQIVVFGLGGLAQGYSIAMVEVPYFVSQQCA